MNHRIKLPVLLVALILFTNTFSQDLVNTKVPFLPGNAYNILKQTWDVNACAKEISPNTTPAELANYKEQLSRVFIVNTNASLVETYTNLSKVGIRNKVNPDLKNDYADFSVEKFNPLKYFFNFYSASQMNYRVDNTNYMIIIVPRQ